MIEVNVLSINTMKKIETFMQPAFVPRRDEKLEINGIMYHVKDVVYNSKNSVIYSIDLLVKTE